MTDPSPVVARRAALVAICRDAANGVIDRVVSEASRAANMFGFGRDAAVRYGDGIREVMPLVWDAMALPDGSDRDAKIATVAARVRAVSENSHIPRIVERGLVSIAVRLAREFIRRRAATSGFTGEELEHEFIAFADRLEDRLFEPER